MEIEFGALAPKLSEQLKGMLPLDFLELLDIWGHEITSLHLHGILNDSAAHKARQRLLKKIEKKYNAVLAEKGVKP